MSIHNFPRQVLAAYHLPWPLDVAPLGSAGGFSGAQFWRVRAAGLDLCLRRWPPSHPDHSRLLYIHAVLEHAAKRGAVEIAAPLAARDRRTFVQHAGCFWELTRWVAGAPDESDLPPPSRVAAALAALARFHKAAASLSATGSANGNLEQPSPGLAERARMTAMLQQSGLDELRAAVGPSVWPEGEAAGAGLIVQQLLDLAPQAAKILQPRLAAAVRQQVRLQPCIRDIWRAHVFFEEHRVSGIIDFGAMRDETVATDVARLLGSYAQDDAGAWQAGLDAYQSLRELTPAERSLVGVFDETTVLLAGINWIRWIYQERREFEQHARIVQRLEVTLQRLQHLIRQGNSGAAV